MLENGRNVELSFIYLAILGYEPFIRRPQIWIAILKRLSFPKDDFNGHFWHFCRNF